MPTYVYFCEKCDKNFDDLCTYEQSKEDKSCPNCETEKCERTYDLSKSDSKSGVVVHSTGQMNYYDVTSRKAQEKEWMESEVKNTKQALKYETGASPYSRVKIPYEKLEKEGVLKKASEDNKRLRVKGAQHVVNEAAKNMSKEDADRTIKGNRNDAG